MIAYLINWSARNIMLVLIGAIFVVAAGIYAVRTLPLDAIPDLSDVQVIVLTDYPGQAPQVVEDQITYPLTTAMLTVPKSRVVRGLPPWILALFSGSIAAGLIIWLLRTRDRLVAMGLALIIGGALGNALDRLRHGAVADFLDFHLADWHWPAFNFADVGIVCGAGLLILDTFIRGHSSAASEVSDRQP